MTRQALVVAVAVGVSGLVGSAHAQVRGGTAVQAATRALFEGRYDEVAAMGQTPETFDVALVPLRAQAHIARGRYAEAEALLRPEADREPLGDAALQLGLLLQMQRRGDAAARLARIAATAPTAGDAPALARAARALRALGRFQEANAAYRDAATAAPRDPSIQTAWGDMFVEGRCQTCNADAVKSYQAALRADTRYTPALVGLSHALMDDDPPQAASVAAKVLEINPLSVDARLLRALQAIDADHTDVARSELGKALEVNPSSVDAHALLGALAYVADDTAGFEAEVAAAHGIAPGAPDPYRVAGDVAARRYRFAEAATLVRRGLALDPQDARSLADLGLHLLRTGEEPAARAALERAFAAHPYDVVVYNLLQMMDTLDQFTTVRDGDLVLRLSAQDAAVLQEPALALAKQALAALSARYGYTPTGPILVEIFGKHDDFAVRNVGLPGMTGALGACFGRVVTMDSPRARPPGEFQWEATLWHELAHVITLQMSGQRVPRWLTEGISVYEEKRARPEWARGMDLQYAGLLNRGETLPLTQLNAAFTDPKSVGLAYFEASLLVDHLVTTYGDEGLHRLLRAYGRGLDTEAALRDALGVNLAGLQTGFDATIQRTFGDLRTVLVTPPEGTVLPRLSLPELTAYVEAHPREYIAQMALGAALRRAGDLPGAEAAFARAAALLPIAPGADGPHGQMTELAERRKDATAAIAALERWVAADFNNVDAARRLARWYGTAQVTDPAKRFAVYQRIVAIDPFDGDAQTALGQAALATQQPPLAVRAFRTALALHPVDEAAARTDLAEALARDGRRADARRQVLAALEIAPGYARAQDLLLTVTEAAR